LLIINMTSLILTQFNTGIEKSDKNPTI